MMKTIAINAKSRGNTMGKRSLFAGAAMAVANDVALLVSALSRVMTCVLPARRLDERRGARQDPIARSHRLRGRGLPDWGYRFSM